MINNKKVGLALITCNRFEFFKKSFNSIKRCFNIIDHFVIVNDGNPYDFEYDGATLIQHKQNQGVGSSKNDALEHMMNIGCDYLFVMEDDIIITDPVIFEKYILLRDLSGIEHFNFGYHGPANRGNISGGKPTPKLIINYGDKVRMALNHNCVGALSFYTKEIIKEVGLMDPKYINAWEHVDHTLTIIKAGKHPPFWWFADVADSHKYISEIACSEVNSSIKGRIDWSSNIRSGALYFNQKHGYFPISIPNSSEQEVISILKKLKS